jgi:hypothetical protein
MNKDIRAKNDKTGELLNGLGEKRKKNAPGMGHFIETKTNETHSLRSLLRACYSIYNLRQLIC